MLEKDRFVDYLAEVPNFLSVFIFSIFYTVASLMLIEISESTGIVIANFSLVFTFYTIGVVFGQLTSIIYNRKFKKIQIILAGYVLTIPIAITISFNSNLIVFYVLYLISGYLLGVIWIQAFQFVLDNKVKNKNRIITVLLSFFPLGAIISPFIASTIIRMDLSWRFAYYIVVFLIVLNMLLYILILGRRKEGVKEDSNSRFGFKEIFTDKAKNIVFLLILLSLVFYCASETVVVTWAPTFLRLARKMDIQSTGYALALFWLFIVIGRGIILFIVRREKVIKIVLVISILAIISMAIVVFMHSQVLIYIFIAAAGLGYSAIGPLLVSTGSTLYEKGRGILITSLFVATNTGHSIGPFLIKFSSSRSMILSVSFSFILMIIVSLIIFFMQLIISRKKVSL